MKKKSVLFLLAAISILMVFTPVILYYNKFQTEMGIAEFEVFDEATSNPIKNASIIVMDREKVYLSNAQGKAIVQIESKPRLPKEFMGYTAMIAAEGYLPVILYNVQVFSFKNSGFTTQYKVTLKKPEAFDNVLFDSEFLPSSSEQMAEILDHYGHLVVPRQ